MESKTVKYAESLESSQDFIPGRPKDPHPPRRWNTSEIAHIPCTHEDRATHVPHIVGRYIVCTRTHTLASVGATMRHDRHRQYQQVFLQRGSRAKMPTDGDAFPIRLEAGCSGWHRKLGETSLLVVVVESTTG